MPAPDGNGEAGAPAGQVFGLGVMRRHVVTAKSPTGKGPPGIVVEIWSLLPLIRTGADGLVPILGTAAHPLTLGVSVSTPDGKPFIEACGLSFGGVKLTASMTMGAKPAVDPSIYLLNIALPNDPVPRDRSLADIAAIGGQEMIDAVSAMFVLALSNMGGALSAGGKDDPLAYLLPFLGLASGEGRLVPPLPRLRWDRVADLAIHGDSPAQPFMDWFTLLLSDTARLKSWLSCLEHLLGTPAARIPGTAERNDPCLATLLTIPDLGTLWFSAASESNGLGWREFYPGLAFRAAGLPLAMAAGSTEPAPQVVLGADLELGQFPLSAAAPPAGVPSSLRFNAVFSLVGSAPGAPLFETAAGSARYRFGALVAGMSLASAGGRPLVVPRFDLLDVVTPNGSFEAIDLLKPGALVDMAERELYALIDQATAGCCCATARPGLIASTASPN